MADRKRVTICLNGDLSKQKCVLLPDTWRAFLDSIQTKFQAGPVVLIKNAKGGEIDELEMIRDDEQLFAETETSSSSIPTPFVQPVIATSPPPPSVSPRPLS